MASAWAGPSTVAQAQRWSHSFVKFGGPHVMWTFSLSSKPNLLGTLHIMSELPVVRWKVAMKIAGWMALEPKVKKGDDE